MLVQKFILMSNPSRVYTVIQSDLPAANGIIHIIDRPVTNALSDRSPKDEQVSCRSLTRHCQQLLTLKLKMFVELLSLFFVKFADKTIGEILTQDVKFNRFLSLVDVSLQNSFLLI